jgi:hypothetical protein
MARRSLLFANLTYLIVVPLLVVGGWHGAHAWFENSRRDIEANWTTFENHRWNGLIPPGLDLAGQLLVAQGNGQSKARLFVVCSELKVHLLSKTIIPMEDVHKPRGEKPERVDAKLYARGMIEEKIPDASWYFISGLDMVLTPELSDVPARFLERITLQGSQFSMHHSETAIYLHPVVNAGAIKAFGERCHSGEALL